MSFCLKIFRVFCVQLKLYQTHTKTKGYISHQYVAFYFFYPQITRISQIYFLFIKLVGFVGKKSMSFVGGNPPNDDGVFLLLKYIFSPIVPIVFGSLLNLRI